MGSEMCIRDRRSLPGREPGAVLPSGRQTRDGTSPTGAGRGGHLPGLSRCRGLPCPCVGGTGAPRGLGWALGERTRGHPNRVRGRSGPRLVVLPGRTPAWVAPAAQLSATTRQVVSRAAAATATSRVQPAAAAAASSSWAHVAHQLTRAGREHHRQRRCARWGVQGERHRPASDVTDPVWCRRAVGTDAGQRCRAQGEGGAAAATAPAAGGTRGRKPALVTLDHSDDRPLKMLGAIPWRPVGSVRSTRGSVFWASPARSTRQPGDPVLPLGRLAASQAAYQSVASSSCVRASGTVCRWHTWS